MTTIDFIDVSMWQGSIDWPNVPVPAVVKATEGATYVDPRFVANRAGARAAQRYLGCYHFLASNASGAAQANHFLDVAQPLDDELVVLDWETDSIGVRPDPSIAEAFVQTARARGQHHRLCLYGNEWLAAYALQWDIPFWCAWYGNAEQQVRDRDAVAWQWSSSEFVAGIAGRVDANKILDPERWFGMPTAQEIADAVWAHTMEKGGYTASMEKWVDHIHEEFKSPTEFQARLVAALKEAFAATAVEGTVELAEGPDIAAVVRAAVDAALDGLTLVRSPPGVP